jgi:hypothetical protein
MVPIRESAAAVGASSPLAVAAEGWAEPCPAVSKKAPVVSRGALAVSNVWSVWRAGAVRAPIPMAQQLIGCRKINPADTNPAAQPQQSSPVGRDNLAYVRRASSPIVNLARFLRRNGQRGRNENHSNSQDRVRRKAERAEPVAEANTLAQLASRSWTGSSTPGRRW